nr:MAG TPA: putative tail fiber protein [Caudoviricetes sp.]
MLLWCEDTKELYIGTGDSVIKPTTQETGLNESILYSILGQGCSKATNGYFKIPVAKGSFIIFQWGVATGFGMGTSRDIYFPLVYPSTCAALAVACGYYQGAGNKGSTAQVYRVANNRFHITSRFEQGAANIDWIAIGW